MSGAPLQAEDAADTSTGPSSDAGFAGKTGRVRILGVSIDNLSFEEALAQLRTDVGGPARRTLFFANAHTLQLAHRSAEFRRALEASDHVFGDGTGVRWAARLQGVRLRSNLNGTDLIPAFMRDANGGGLRYYLLGASPEVVARAAAVTTARFPGWRLAGHHHGFLDSAASDQVVAEINALRPHLLLVGMGNPIQEQWIAANRDRLETNLAIGVGGLFSYLSGDYRRAPLAMRRLGLEWFAVLLTQRQKWRRYVLGAPAFLLSVVIERLSGRTVG